MKKFFRDIQTFLAYHHSPIEQARCRSLLKALINNEYIFSDPRLPKVIGVGWHQVINILNALEEAHLIGFEDNNEQVSCHVTKAGLEFINQKGSGRQKNDGAIFKPESSVGF